MPAPARLTVPSRLVAALWCLTSSLVAGARALGAPIVDCRVRRHYDADSA